MTIPRTVILGTALMLACGSQKPEENTVNSQPNAGAGGQSGDSGMSGSGGAGEGGQSSDMGGVTSNAAGGISNAGAGNATGGTTMTQGGSQNATGGTPPATGGSASPGLPSQCSQKATPGQSQPVSGITLDPSSHFAGITPDELTLLWTTASSSGTTVTVVDRTSVNDAWGTPQSIANVPAADNMVTVTPDGLVIAYVDNSNRLTYATFSRPDRTSMFVFPDPNSGLDFAVQNTSPDLSPGDVYACPLYGPHLTSFYYAIRTAAGDTNWYVAGRFEEQGTFSTGSALSFASRPGATLVLSGISIDENTLFFVDTTANQSSWSFYDEIALKFGALSSLGNLGYVQPSQSCARLYGGPAAGVITTTPLQ